MKQFVQGGMLHVVNLRLKCISIAAMVAVAVIVSGQAVLAADPQAGQSVYQKNACNACHGAKGEGGAGPALSGAAFAGKYASADALADVIRKGTSKGMPPYAEDKIANADMINMVAYIQGFTAAGAAAPKAAAAAPKAPSEAKSEPAKAAGVDKSAEKPAEATQAGMTLEQAYVIVIAVLGVLLMLVFVIVLNGPLKVSNR